MNEIHLRVDDELEKKLKALATSRNEPVAVVVRRLLSEALAGESAVTALDVIRSAIREVIRNEMKPLENRLAKLNAKTGASSATAMFMLIQTLDDLGKHDCVEIYEKARKKAVAYLKEPVREG